MIWGVKLMTNKATVKLTYNGNFIETSVLRDVSKITDVLNNINPFVTTGNVSVDQVKNDGLQTFKDGTQSTYVHVDQDFSKIGLIKGYTRTITFPNAIVKQNDTKGIKKINVN